ncbi:MAG: cytochrome c-type biogenesis protein CcmE [Saprospiraceae bacterium]|jgi:cytochrome c-type biogenesis protein CcmE
MKKTHIIAIVMIIAAIGIFINSGQDMTAFSTFKQATKSAQIVKVSGDLVKSKEMYYNPQENENLFSFYMKDSEGQERKVILASEKPQDFERSENLVVTGKMEGEDFIASDMLMKCPSKYKDEEVFVKAKAGM